MNTIDDIEKDIVYMVDNYSIPKEFILNENIDILKLQIIHDNFDDFKDKIGFLRSKASGFKKDIGYAATKTMIAKRLNKHDKTKIIYKTNKDSDGRPFATCLSSQGMNKVLNHTLSYGFTVDIDQVNSHYVIACQYAEYFDLPTTNFKEYINNRITFLDKYCDYYNCDKDTAKTGFIVLLNDQNQKIQKESPVHELYKEILILQDKIAEYRDKVYKKCLKDDKVNPKGKNIARFLQYVESKITYCQIEYCEENNLKVSSHNFDGLQLYLENEPENHLRDMEKYVYDKLGLNIKLAVKPFTKMLDVEWNNFSIKAGKNKDENIVFDFTDFDEGKIIDIDYVWADFVKQFYAVFKTKRDLITKFEIFFPKVCALVESKTGFYYKKDSLSDMDSDGYSIVKKSSITLKFKYFDVKQNLKVIDLEDLIKESNTVIYSRIVCNPKNDISRLDYNTWKPLIGNVPIEISMDKLKPLLDFIFIVICNNDIPAYKFIISWIRHICKYPWIKTRKVPILISGQRCGKGSLTSFLIDHVFGHYCSTTVRGIDRITQKHNTMLKNKVFIVVDELSTTSESFFSAFDKLKGLITDTTMEIEPKGIDAFSMRNFINLMFTTNNEYSVRLEHDDSRYFPLQINECHKDDQVYFKDLYDNTFTAEIGRMFFNYLCDIPDDSDEIVSIHTIPNSELKQRLQGFSMSSIELFNQAVIDKTAKVSFYEPFEYKGEIIENAIRKHNFYDQYKAFCNDTGEKIQKLKIVNGFYKQFKSGDKRWIRTDKLQRDSNGSETQSVISDNSSIVADVIADDILNINDFDEKEFE